MAQCIHCGSSDIWSDMTMEGCNTCGKWWSTTPDDWSLPPIVPVESSSDEEEDWD